LYADSYSIYPGKKEICFTISSENVTLVTLGFLNEPSEYNKFFSRGMLVDLGEPCLCVISGSAGIACRGASRYRNDFSSLKIADAS